MSGAEKKEIERINAALRKILCYLPTVDTPYSIATSGLILENAITATRLIMRTLDGDDVSDGVDNDRT